ncbi:MAG TPA: DUF3237 domain-containing protein [Solirubrobacteraceae bacterium]
MPPPDPQPMHPAAPELGFLFSYLLTGLADVQMLGELPEGARANFINDDGVEVRGPRINGRMLPWGGDWLTVRRDGIALLDVRNVIETVEGARILYRYHGVADMGADGFERFVSGEPPAAQLRGAPLMSTAHPDFLWVNRIQAIVAGEIVPAAPSELAVFAIG